jgi:parvulin-like peptidyl-prolyl isomerase
VDAVAFSLPVGEVSDPIQTENGAAIIRVIERQEVKDEEVAAGRQQLRQELLNEHRNRFYSSYMTKAREKMRIQMNNAVLAQVIT